jgi:hypothetical protein
MKKIYLFTCLLFFCLNHSYAQISVGLFTHLSGSDDDGYVLFAPTQNCDTTYLIDKCGRLVHKWPSKYTPGLDVYLLPDGSLLRSGHYLNSLFDICNCGTGGIIERIDWSGNVVWHYIISDTLQVQSHDIHYMPNGHILVDVWENIKGADAIAAGRKPTLLGGNLYSPKVMELVPVGTDSAVVVWQWRAWDHLIQDYDGTKANYGTVANHPELINLNYMNLAADPAMSPDWTHMNAVVYNQDLDQVMVSAHNFDEIWIIDHSTTTAEAATHAGGKHGKGGDLLYRWGNPVAYNKGIASDTKFFQQHNCTWISNGKYKGQIMVFNNGLGRPGRSASSVDIIKPPVDTAGNYTLLPGGTYGPDTLTWTYESSPPSDLYSMYMGGAQMLPNGNILITEAMSGHFIEIDSNKNTVWEYVNPVDDGAPVSQGKIVSLNEVYRCVFYPSEYPAFSIDTVKPGTTPIESFPISYICNVNLNTPYIKPNMAAIDIYPNPANVSITVQSQNIESIKLMDISGRELINEKYNYTQRAEINTAELANGIYILCINNSVYKRFVIQH